MKKLLLTLILMMGVTHAPTLVELQTVVAETAARSGDAQTGGLAEEDRRVHGHREQGPGQVTGEYVAATRRGRQTTPISPAAQDVDCECGPDCKCADPMVCKNGDCKRNYVIFFSAEWCRPCQKMYPRIEELRNAGYIIYVLDADKYPKAAEAFQIKSLPTTIVMDKGKEIARFVGVVEKERITAVTKIKDEQTCDYNFL